MRKIISHIMYYCKYYYDYFDIKYTTGLMSVCYVCMNGWMGRMMVGDIGGETHFSNCQMTCQGLWEGIHHIPAPCVPPYLALFSLYPEIDGSQAVLEQLSRHWLSLSLSLSSTHNGFIYRHEADYL